MLVVTAAIAVLEDPADAVTALDPVRAAMLDQLAAVPASATGLGVRLGLGRQKANYHLALLEARGLVVEVDRRSHGGLVERVLGLAAGGFVVSPSAFGRAGARPEQVSDRLSASYAVALAARVVRELGRLVVKADESSRRLPALAIDVDIRFGSAADRAAFADDAAVAIRTLAARYHDEGRAGGRWYRVAFLAHPRPQEAAPT
jgi:DNA-binding transcriptional ArsR family regulator